MCVLNAVAVTDHILPDVPRPIRYDTIRHFHGPECCVHRCIQPTLLIECLVNSGSTRGSRSNTHLHISIAAVQLALRGRLNSVRLFSGVLFCLKSVRTVKNYNCYKFFCQIVPSILKMNSVFPGISLEFWCQISKMSEWDASL